MLNILSVSSEPFDDALGVTTMAAPPLAEQLQNEPWFHGPLSRRQAERLLSKDGDFLVRESGTTPGQYVLTGQQGGQPKHLLLVDPEGVVSGFVRFTGRLNSRLGLSIITACRCIALFCYCLRGNYGIISPNSAGYILECFRVFICGRKSYWSPGGQQR